MKALFVPEARMMIVSLGADGAPGYTLLSLDDWIDGLRGAALTDGLAQELDARIVRSGQSTLQPLSSSRLSISIFFKSFNSRCHLPGQIVGSIVIRLHGVITLRRVPGLSAVHASAPRAEVFSSTGAR